LSNKRVFEIGFNRVPYIELLYYRLLCSMKFLLIVKGQAIDQTLLQEL